MRNFTDRDWRRAAALALFAAAAAYPFRRLRPGTTKTVEFVVPPAPAEAPTDGPGCSRHHCQEQVDEAADGGRQQGGRAGAEGFLDVKEAKGDAHKIIITLSNLFTTRLRLIRRSTGAT